MIIMKKAIKMKLNTNYLNSEKIVWCVKYYDEMAQQGGRNNQIIGVRLARKCTALNVILKTTKSGLNNYMVNSTDKKSIQN